MMIDNPESPLPATPLEREYLQEFADRPEILAAFVRDDPLWLDLRERIEHAMLNRPRNLQRVIGPSEIGIECDRCLGHKLAQTPKRESPAWLPNIGSCVHEWLAGVFGDSELHRPEERVCIGEVGGVSVDGSSDLYVAETVVDWKVVGDAKLKEVKAKGPTQQYIVQGQAYGRGWQRAGFPVKRIVICYLPRNKNSLDHALWWSQDYDESVVLRALARANAMASAGAALGWDVLLPRLRKQPGCYDCSRYPSFPSDPKLGLDDVITL